MKHTRIVIGTRGSQMALVQTRTIKDLLQPFLPNTTIDIKIVKTVGDKNMNPIPLDTVGKGWFTKELDKELLMGNIDLAVHSLKDLPEVLPEGLMIAGIPERDDPRDALVAKDAALLENLKSGAVIGTDSMRRKVQILQKRKDIIVESVRGNVNRRLEKLDNGEYDGLILAVAGIKRLGLEERISQYFETADVIPSPGQGALAVVVKKDNRVLIAAIKNINHHATVAATQAERAFSAAVGGGCKTPTGAYAQSIGNRLLLRGMIGSLDGRHVVKDEMTGSIAKPATLGTALAEKLLKTCSPWYDSKIKNQKLKIKKTD